MPMSQRLRALLEMRRVDEDDLNVNRDGMHAALKRFEDGRAAEMERPTGRKTVAKPNGADDQPKSDRASKSVE